MTAAAPSLPDSPVRTAGPLPTAAAPVVDVEIVVPVHNEQVALAASVRRLHAYLRASFPFRWRVLIVDNASTDGTAGIARQLAAELPGVGWARLAQKGRGRALHAAWGRSDATVVAYLDVDLSTDLRALLPLVAPLLSGHSDLAIGSRLTRTARVERGPKREIISRAYNVLLHTTLGTHFSDAQCGFKAIRTDRARLLLPWVEDTGWFFDTELLVLAERSGMRIHEVPVDWVDDLDSRVDIVRTAAADLRGMVRVSRNVLTGRVPLDELRLAQRAGDPARTEPAPAAGRRVLTTQLARFGAIGVASTVAYLVLFALMRPGLGAQLANAAALLATAVANTAANRRFTFGRRGRTGAAADQVGGLVAFGLGLVLTSSALGLLHAAVAAPARTLELGTLVAANLVATALRFVLLRAWVLRPAASG